MQSKNLRFIGRQCHCVIHDYVVTRVNSIDSNWIIFVNLVVSSITLNIGAYSHFKISCNLQRYAMLFG